MHFLHLKELYSLQVDMEDNVFEKQQPSLDIKLDLSPLNCDVNSSVKVSDVPKLLSPLITSNSNLLLF